MTRFLTSKREEDRETAELIRSLRADNERLRRDLAERDRQLSESVTDETELQRELAEARNRQSCDNGQPWICHALATARSELAEARWLLRSGCTAFEEKRLGKWMQDVAVFLAASDQPSLVACAECRGGGEVIERGRVVGCEKCNGTGTTTDKSPE